MYENGASVNTSFVTNMGGNKIVAAADLREILDDENKQNLKKLHRELPKYSYPDEVLTATMLCYMAAHGVSLEIRERDAHFIRALDAQKASGKGLFGSGFLLSEKAAAEKTAAEGSEWDMSDLSTDWGAEGEGMKAYNCPSCGAQLICDATTAATSCPYCGNPTVVPGQFAGTLKPDFVIPFKLSREDAIQRLKQHYKGKVFLPKSFSSENHLQEISGVYVPFWMFSGKAEGDVHFDATRSRTYKSGDYRITETDHYDAYRAGSLAFEKIPVDGSEKMPDEHMDSIEPYDYSELKPFSTAYLPGFLADKFDVTAEDSRQRADSRCAGTLRSALEKTVSGYETCSARESNTTIKRGKVHYALMPVWMLNTKWRGKDFLFAMNGQTGKLVGDLPVDKGRYWAMFFAIAVPLSAIGSFLAMTLLR